MVGSTYGQWFQRSDAVRYVQLFDKVVIEAVRGCLEERGIALAQFAKFAETAIDNFGDVNNSVIAAGSNSTATSNTSTSGPS